MEILYSHWYFHRLVADFVVFFFFQAEDGIRDWSVTGVQTCALPICSWHDHPRAEQGAKRLELRDHVALCIDHLQVGGVLGRSGPFDRSGRHSPRGSRAISLELPRKIGRASCRERV